MTDNDFTVETQNLFSGAPENIISAVEQIDTIERAIQTMCPDVREAYTTKIKLEGTPTEEICEQQDILPNAFRSRIWRARQHIEKHIESENKPPQISTSEKATLDV